MGEELKFWVVDAFVNDNIHFPLTLVVYCTLRFWMVFENKSQQCQLWSQTVWSVLCPAMAITGICDLEQIT